jgi:hypothetical protein
VEKSGGRCGGTRQLAAEPEDLHHRGTLARLGARLERAEGTQAGLHGTATHREATWCQTTWRL